MKELSEFLTDREIFILENHPALSYKAIGEQLGISMERIRQIKAYAQRKIQSEKKKEQVAARGRIPVSFTLQRRDIWLLLRSLDRYRYALRREERRTKASESVIDPDIKCTEELIEKLHGILNAAP